MTTRIPVPRLRAYEGPALLSYGFRPFFLLGSIYVGLAVLVWLPVFYGELALHSAFAPRDWHVHEMLYGLLAGGDHGLSLHRNPDTGRGSFRSRESRCWHSFWRGSPDGSP